jgi:hypothetical protein
MAYQRDEALTTCATKNRSFWTLAGVLANYTTKKRLKIGVTPRRACFWGLRV